MGTFRLYLALLIFFTQAKYFHLLPEWLLPGVTASAFDPRINLFFMLAGFFARKLVMEYRYDRDRLWPFKFYAERCLRLWPVYWCCLLLVFIFHHALWHDYAYYSSMRGTPRWWMLLQNVIPFLPDTYAIGSFPDPSLKLMLYPAWTLGMLMGLFLLSPLLLYRGLLYLFFLLSLPLLFNAYRYYGVMHGYVVIALPYFLAGAIAFDIYHQLNMEVLPAHRWNIVLLLLPFAVLAAGILSVYTSVLVFFDEYVVHFSVLALAWIGLPSLFYISRNNRIDRYLSNLCYPLYLSQYLVFYLLLKCRWSPETNHIVVLPAALLVAALMHHWIERPLMRYRSHPEAL